MKKYYKLLKDLPTADAGTEFYLDESEDSPVLRFLDTDSALYFVSPFQCWKKEGEWFEEIEKPKMKFYFYIDDRGDVCLAHEQNGYDDNHRWETGNYFRTDREAELHRVKLIAYQRVKDDAHEFCPKRGEHSFHICFDEDEDEGGLIVGEKSWTKLLGVSFETEEEALTSIKEHEAEWLLLFDVIDLNEYEKRKEQNG